MTTTEFDLLLAFCRYPGRVLSREDLLSMTYAGLAGPIEQSVDVSRLPRKIDAALDKPNDIQAVRLAGYLFTPDVVEGRGTGGPTLSLDSWLPSSSSPS
ncbi:helix-turn-helix domain-containing protein [Salipiger marinus]|uniref:winged helix-turn-helix domain-containing protein n=1 Tax=Salipiger marinus TaxID=555512 RepID=UPI002B983887|nr:helix-turn-helix domain-containing protein [Salipiger manganoxidans]MEB3419200.1 helix-turn-helix domain-containing protein [Salipiger manganoxidans]